MEHNEAPSSQQPQRHDHYRSDSISSNYVISPSPPQRRYRQGLDVHGPPIPSTGAMISIAVDPVALITTECITVTSAMRKHSRWAQSSVSAILGGGAPRREVGRPIRHDDQGFSPSQHQSRPSRSPNSLARDDDTLANRWGLRGKKGKSIQDNPLMSAFARLRNDLRGCTGQIC